MRNNNFTHRRTEGATSEAWESGREVEVGEGRKKDLGKGKEGACCGLFISWSSPLPVATWGDNVRTKQ